MSIYYFTLEQVFLVRHILYFSLIASGNYALLSRSTITAVHAENNKTGQSKKSGVKHGLRSGQLFRARRAQSCKRGSQEDSNQPQD